MKSSYAFFALSLTLTCAFAHADSSSVDEGARAGVIAFYKQKAADSSTKWSAARNKLLAKIKDDCGGRYDEPTYSVTLLESGSDQSFTESKTDPNKLDGYAESLKSYLVVENANCSVHHGFYQSVLNSVVISNEIHSTWTGITENDQGDVGAPTSQKSTYKLGAQRLTDFNKKPYDAPSPGNN